MDSRYSRHCNVFAEIEPAKGDIPKQPLRYDVDYDGTYTYGYDAWNRMITVKNAYRTDDGVLRNGGHAALRAEDFAAENSKNA